MARKINDAGLALVKQWEGKYLKAYHGAADRPGLWTVGYGHTDSAGPPKVTPGMEITEDEAVNILRSDLSKCEAEVEHLVRVPLNDNQFATLVSFVFNCGGANFQKSSLLRKLNSGDYDCVPSELMKWTMANGKRVQGLANRRAAEGGLWVKGAPVASQYVEPEAKTETVASSLLKPETIATVASGSGGLLAAFNGLSGPIAYAVAFAIFAGTITALVFLIKNIKARSA